MLLASNDLYKRLSRSEQNYQGDETDVESEKTRKIMTTAAAIIHISQRLHTLRTVCLQGESIPYELVFID